MRLTLTTFDTAGNELGSRRVWLDEVLTPEPTDEDGDLVDFIQQVRGV